MSKQWELVRGDLKKNGEYFGKPNNPVKFKELYDQLDFVCQTFSQADTVKTLTRKIVEEVMNIVEHNKSWNKIKVRTEHNPSKTRFKAEIIYDGGEYFDPKSYCTGNVIGSTERFKEYKRNFEIGSDRSMTVTIRINIEP